MGAFPLLLAATLALQALAGRGNSLPDAWTPHARTPRSPKCPAACPKERNDGAHEYKGRLSFTPKGSEATLHYIGKMSLGPKVAKTKTVKSGQTVHVSPNSFEIEGETFPKSRDAFWVSGAIRYCDEGDTAALTCLTTTTTTTTRTSTSTTTTKATQPVTNATTLATPPPTASQGLETFLVVVSAASVLLRLMLVARSGAAFCRTLAGLNRRIAAVQGTSTHILHALRDALVLDFGLGVCLCLLLPCACVCGYALTLTLTVPRHAPSLAVLCYMLGTACLLLHGFFCARKVNGVIKAVVVAQHRPQYRPRPASGRHHTGVQEEEASASGSSEDQECSNPAVTAVLKLCLVLLVLCLCVLSYSLLVVVREGREGEQPAMP